MSKRLGSRVNQLKAKNREKGGKGSYIVSERVDPLLTADEVEYMLGCYTIQYFDLAIG